MAEKIDIGTVIFAINDPDKYKEYEKHVKEIQEWLDKQPKGQKTVVFYMGREYRFNYSKNTKIKYKQTVDKFHPVKRSPEYKTDFINVTEGRVRTANPEEIAFLDLHGGFKREADRELSPMEKERKDFKDLQHDKEMLALEVDKIKEQLREVKAIKEIEKDEPVSNTRQKKNS